MQDFELKQQENNSCFDLTVDGVDFGSVDGLETTVALYLFTDARASSSEEQQSSKRRGWLGNIFRLFDLGSLLWLLSQVRNTQEIRNKAEQYAINALEPLIRDNLASEINVEVTEVTDTGMQLNIDIIIKTGQVGKFTFWLNTDLGNLENANNS
ncbi:phage GP46 family protein [Candidatus Pacearchaeota archaeon]|nr:phage GP46 family protein [Candidatus Pacearchaeota archaeon]